MDAPEPAFPDYVNRALSAYAAEYSKAITEGLTPGQAELRALEAALKAVPHLSDPEQD